MENMICDGDITEFVASQGSHNLDFLNLKNVCIRDGKQKEALPMFFALQEIENSLKNEIENIEEDMNQMEQEPKYMHEEEYQKGVPVEELLQQDSKYYFAIQNETIPEGETSEFSSLFRGSMMDIETGGPENILIQNSNFMQGISATKIKVEKEDSECKQKISPPSPLQLVNNPVLSKFPFKENRFILNDISLNSSNDMKNYSSLNKSCKKTSAVESMEIGTSVSDGFDQLNYNKIKKMEHTTTTWNPFNPTISLSFAPVAKEEDKSEIQNKSVLIDDDGDSPLHIIIARIDEYGIDYIRAHQKLFQPFINHANNCRQTPLHMAAFLGNEKLVKFLLHLGANLSLCDEHLNTPLHVVLQNYESSRAYQMVKVMLENNKSSNKSFINQLNDKGLAAIHLAAKTRDLELMKLLHRNGADIDIQENKSGFTALTKVIKRGLTKENNVDEQSKYFKLAKSIVTQLGADVNVCTYSDDSPLHLACLANNMELAKVLLSKEAEVNMKNINKKTEKDLTTDQQIKDLLEPMYRKKRRLKMKSLIHDE